MKVIPTITKFSIAIAASSMVPKCPTKVWVMALSEY